MSIKTKEKPVTAAPRRSGKCVSPHSVFMRRTLSIYRHQQQRFGPRRKGKVIIRHGREIPFTLEQFRAWVREHISILPGAAKPCPCQYCCVWVTIGSFAVDHATPVSRKGELGLSNLVICCESCNRIKGSLTAGEYLALREGLATFPEPARNDLYGRLKTGAGFVRLRFLKPKTKTQPTAEAAL